MKFCYNTNFTLPKQSKRSRSVLKDGSRSLGLFWKEKNPSYNRRNTVSLMKFSFEMFSPTEGIPANVDPSFKTAVDFWDGFGREKHLTYDKRNTVHFMTHICI